MISRLEVDSGEYEVAEVYLPFVRDRDPVSKTLCNKVQAAVRRKCSQQYSIWHLITTYIPILGWIPEYNVKGYLVRDLIAGLTVGTLAIPQALGYAIVAGVSPIFGLYTSFIPPLIYTILGTSRHVSVGTFALICLMTGKSVADIMERHVSSTSDSSNLSTFSNGTTSQQLLTSNEVASTLAFAVGVWQVILGLLGLGSLTVYLSDRVVKGFACGASFHIFVTQLKWIFGLPLPKRRGFFNLLYTLVDFVQLMPLIHIPTCIFSLICIVALISAKILNGNKRVLKVIRFPIPMELLVIIFASVASYVMDLRVIYGVDTVRNIPRSLPQPHLPKFYLLPEILVDSLMIGLIAFSTAVSAGRLFAQKHQYQIYPNQELRALGVANIIPSFFQCFPSSVALARSVVQESVGGATQIVSIMMGGMVMLVITVLAPFLEPVPKACLGSIIVVALIPILLQVADVGRLWKISRFEAVIFLVPVVFIVLLDVEAGLAIGVVFSLFVTILRQQMPKVQVLGRARRDSSLTHPGHREVQLIPGVNVIRITSPIYFANAEICMEKVRKLAFANFVERKMSIEELEKPTKLKVDNFTSAEEEVYKVLVDKNGTYVETKENSSLIEKQETKLPSPDVHIVPVVNGEVSKFLPAASDVAVVLDMVAVQFVDITGVDVLKRFRKECLKKGYSLFLAACSSDVKRTLIACATAAEFPPKVFLDTVPGAVNNALRPNIES